MRANYGIGQLSASEKSDILDQHRSLYNGYQTMQPQVSNTQPLYVYDAAGDKEGLVVNNKGEVKRYTNMGINEQVETDLEENKLKDFFNKKPNKNKGKVLLPKGDKKLNMPIWDDKTGKRIDLESKSMCECGGQMYEGECMECGSTMMEETGHLDDIYNQKDLNLKHGDFDYVEGGGNDYGTFEGMHKNLYKEDDIIDDDGFEDMELSTDELDEQGGNADDMDTDSVEPAYDFESNGPGDVYPVNEYDDEEEDEFEFEAMESAWADEVDENDVSGSQGIYGDMDPAYDFDSDGPGNAGPYQTSSYNEEEEIEDEDEFMDYDGDDASTWPGNNFYDEPEWEEIDDDLMEDFQSQKNKISEMFNRMSRYN